MELASLTVPRSISIQLMLPLHLFGDLYRHSMTNFRSMKVVILGFGRNRMADVCNRVSLVDFGKPRFKRKDKQEQGPADLRNR